jgi:hypothetical protein
LKRGGRSIGADLLGVLNGREGRLLFESGVKSLLWLDTDKVCDSFTASLHIPKELSSKVTFFTPANDRYLDCQGDWLVSNCKVQSEIGSCTQGNVAMHLATSGREVEQDSFFCTGIALDTGRVADWHSRATFLAASLESPI